MTEYTSTAETICEELGFDPADAARAAERTARRRDRVDNWAVDQTTLQLPTGDHVHKHQLVVDTDDGTHYMIKQLNSDRIKLVEVHAPTDRDEIGPGYGPVGFGASYWLTIGDFLRTADPQYASDGSPVWAY